MFIRKHSDIKTFIFDLSNMDKGSKLSVVDTFGKIIERQEEAIKKTNNKTACSLVLPIRTTDAILYSYNRQTDYLIFHELLGDLIPDYRREINNHYDIYRKGSDNIPVNDRTTKKIVDYTTHEIIEQKQLLAKDKLKQLKIVDSRNNCATPCCPIDNEITGNMDTIIISTGLYSLSELPWILYQWAQHKGRYYTPVDRLSNVFPKSNDTTIIDYLTKAFNIRSDKDTLYNDWYKYIYSSNYTKELYPISSNYPNRTVYSVLEESFVGSLKSNLNIFVPVTFMFFFENFNYFLRNIPENTKIVRNLKLANLFRADSGSFYLYDKVRYNDFAHKVENTIIKLSSSLSERLLESKLKDLLEDKKIKTLTINDNKYNVSEENSESDLLNLFQFYNKKEEIRIKQEDKEHSERMYIRLPDGRICLSYYTHRNLGYIKLNLLPDVFTPVYLSSFITFPYLLSPTVSIEDIKTYFEKVKNKQQQLREKFNKTENIIPEEAFLLEQAEFLALAFIPKLFNESYITNRDDWNIFESDTKRLYEAVCKYDYDTSFVRNFSHNSVYRLFSSLSLNYDMIYIMTKFFYSVCKNTNFSIDTFINAYKEIPISYSFTKERFVKNLSNNLKEITNASKEREIRGGAILIHAIDGIHNKNTALFRDLKQIEIRNISLLTKLLDRLQKEDLLNDLVLEAIKELVICKQLTSDTGQLMSMFFKSNGEFVPWQKYESNHRPSGKIKGILKKTVTKLSKTPTHDELAEVWYNEITEYYNSSIKSVF